MTTNKIQTNIVTCGNCSGIVTHLVDAQSIKCHHCGYNSDPCDFPDLIPAKCHVYDIRSITNIMRYTTQVQIRAAFWASHPDLESYALKWGIKTAPQNRHNATTRTAFVDFVDALARAGQISSELAFRATL